MSRVSIYLNTMGRTEEQFAFYSSVFGTEPVDLTRMGDMPEMPGSEGLPDGERDKIMHVALEILGGTVIMGTDMLESMGHTSTTGNNMSINLEPDTIEEGQRIFDALSTGGSDITPYGLAPWGAHWGTFVDAFGIRWMVNVEAGGTP